ncbi:MAG: hypothetical protein LUQ37_09025 [Methanoregulaceae archaeon]|jgi:hypothetical protein|nr:hypothetical protein [Methanoregulaceae archaeon]
MRIGMLVAVIVVIILLLIVIALVAAALLLSTGYSPGGETSGLYGLVSFLETVGGAMVTGFADWINYIASQIAG